MRGWAAACGLIAIAGCGSTSTDAPVDTTGSPERDGGAPDGSHPGADAAGVDAGGAGVVDGSAPPGEAGPLPRVIAYVNCVCGFGAGAQGGACLASPDPSVNHVEAWEKAGTSPITHYVLSFLSFKGSEIQTDPGSIWATGGGSTTDFALEAHLRAAMVAAHARGKKIVLSLGGEAGSSAFLAWWTGLGGSSPARVTAMRAKLESAAAAFASQNGVAADGFDVDIELGGVYAPASDKYVATRDLIDAVPDRFLVAFVPQVGNGLCAAPVVGDPLPPPTVLGGQCAQPVNGDDTPWSLARLDHDCRRQGGGPKLDWYGIQYYNAGQAECCGGGADATAMIRSAAQSYTNLANGWPASGDTTDPANPWNKWAYYPGPWAAFDGIGADRLVLGKPGCQGCAGSNYVDLAAMKDLLGRLDGRLRGAMGGVLFWDLCRLFGDKGPQCVSGSCQPSWGGPDVLENLTGLREQMARLQRAAP